MFPDIFSLYVLCTMTAVSLFNYISQEKTRKLTKNSSVLLLSKVVY